MSFTKRIKKSQAGFTLVELMVVVAIIGILSAVAIPNFKKYQSKSKTSEAKLALAAIYMAEATFMGDADTYATCIYDMGYVPTGGNNTAYSATAGSASRFYNIGFLTPSATGGAPNGISCTDANDQYNGTKGGTSATHVLPASTANATSFTAGAAGVVSRDFATAANCSAFTMTDLKVLSIPAGRNGY